MNSRGQALIAASTAASISAQQAARLKMLDQQAEKELQADPEMQRTYPEIATFFSNLGRYDSATQQKILAQVQSEANAQVDGSFNSEEDFIKRLQAIKNSTIQEKLATFKEKEATSLQRNLGEISRTAGDAGTKYFAGLASNNALDTGTLGSYADRLVEDLLSKQSKEQSDSALAVKEAEQAAAADTSLADMTAEEQLFIGDNSVSARREAARAERYASLLGLSADQELLAQTPTALNDMSTTPAKTTEPASYLPARITTSTSLRSPTPAVTSTAQTRGAARAQKLLSTYGASSLNSRGRAFVGL